MASIHRKFMATLLMVVVLGIGFPGLGTAGGCDEPGYTGGSCSKSENQGHNPPPNGENPGPGSEPGDGSGGGGGGGGGKGLPSTSTESASSTLGILSQMAQSILTFLFALPVK